MKTMPSIKWDGIEPPMGHKPRPLKMGSVSTAKPINKRTRSAINESLSDFFTIRLFSGQNGLIRWKIAVDAARCGPICDDLWFFFICADAFEFHLECVLTLHLLIERVWNLKLKSEQNETKTAAVDRHLKQRNQWPFQSQLHRL